MVGLAVLGVWLVKSYLLSYPASARIVPDPSAVIGTFVTLYGLLIGGFGVLAGFLVAKNVKGKPRPWEALKSSALTLLAAAAIADLILVLYAANDLFTAATHGMSYPALHDNVIDFQIYFSLNLLVGGFSIVVSSLLPD